MFMDAEKERLNIKVNQVYTYIYILRDKYIIYIKRHFRSFFVKQYS